MLQKFEVIHKLVVLLCVDIEDSCLLIFYFIDSSFYSWIWDTFLIIQEVGWIVFISIFIIVLLVKVGFFLGYFITLKLTVSDELFSKVNPMLLSSVIGFILIDSGFIVSVVVFVIESAFIII